MVHNLRNRNVCNTSPRPNQIQEYLFNVAQSTPNHNRRKQRESRKDTNNNQYSTILENVSNMEQELPITFNHEDDKEMTIDNSTNFDLNTTKYTHKLHKLVDEYIFEHTFKKRSGVSLYAIKKSLEKDHSFKPNKFSKPVSRYIAFSIGTGKLQQITGHGASGTFRLNREIHNKCVRNLVKLRKVSSQSHTIQKRVTKISKQNTVA